MIAAAPGVMINNASVLGWRAQAGQAHYAAAKAGVMALTRCAAIEAAPAGVRVNAVAPSIAMHPFLAKVSSEELLAELSGARGLRPGRRAVGGRRRDRLPRQRLLVLHDRRDCLGQQPAPVTEDADGQLGSQRARSGKPFDRRYRARQDPRVRGRDALGEPGATWTERAAPSSRPRSSPRTFFWEELGAAAATPGSSVRAGPAARHARRAGVRLSRAAPARRRRGSPRSRGSARSTTSRAAAAAR